mgnify:CR=1 FL=1
METLGKPDFTFTHRIIETVNDYDNFKPADHTKFKDYSDEQIFRKGEYIYSSGKSFSYDWSLTLSYSRNFKEKPSSMSVWITMLLRKNRILILFR